MSRHRAVYEITNAQISDTGAYTCVASNSAGQQEEQIQVTVTGWPNVPPTNSIAPTSIIPSLTPDEEIAFPLGSVASLRCDVGTYEKKRIET